MEFESNLSDLARGALLAAGWYSQRRVAVALPFPHPAASILAALSGLRVGAAGPGETCACSDIHFFALPHDDAVIREWSRLLGTALLGIGEAHHTHCELWIAEDGRCFGRSLVHPAVWFEGAHIAEAIDRLLRGLRGRPLVHPDQDSVMLYGDTYTRDHPDVYDFARRER